MEVQKVGLYALLAILGFAVVFVAIPTGKTVESKTGATLHNVKLTLYPSSDPDAVWRFAAKTVTNDPINSLTKLTELSEGQRLIRPKNTKGERTGKEVLDATLTTDTLTINGQDDLLTDKAKIKLVKHCADIDLVGKPNNPVMIKQGFGFFTPLATVDSPVMKMRFLDLQMSFQFYVEQASPESESIADLDGKERCENGKRVIIKEEE